jgi:hypothetical protein
MYETDFAVSILSCVFILPFLPSRWWPIGLKHVIELILNKQIVVFHRICCDSCYLKQSRDESSLKKTWFICWSETTLAVWYVVFLELCTAPALWSMQVAFFLLPPSICHHVIIHPVRAAAGISGVVYEMLFGSQCHSSQFAHHPVHRVL